MPKLVDHDERRTRIVDAYLRIVARSGVAAATSRALAAEAEISAGALWHYFDGFGDVVRAAFERVYTQTNERIDAATVGRRGLGALAAMAVHILPQDVRTREEAVVVVSFWGLLPAHAEFRELSRDVEADWGRKVSNHLAEAVEDGELIAETPIASLSDALLIVYDAVQLREVQGSPVAAQERQSALLSHLIEPWRVS